MDQDTKSAGGYLTRHLEASREIAHGDRSITTGERFRCNDVDADYYVAHKMASEVKAQTKPAPAPTMAPTAAPTPAPTPAPTEPPSPPPSASPTPSPATPRRFGSSRISSGG